MNHLFDVTDRLALVTGSSRGIGRALAEGLLTAGAAVVINGRDEDSLRRAADQLERATGRRPHVAVFDVTDSKSVETNVDRIETGIGPIEIVVNNAGGQRRAPSPSSPARTGTTCSRST